MFFSPYDRRQYKSQTLNPPFDIPSSVSRLCFPYLAHTPASCTPLFQIDHQDVSSSGPVVVIVRAQRRSPSPSISKLSHFSSSVSSLTRYNRMRQCYIRLLRVIARSENDWVKRKCHEAQKLFARCFCKGRHGPVALRIDPLGRYNTDFNLFIVICRFLELSKFTRA